MISPTSTLGGVPFASKRNRLTAQNPPYGCRRSNERSQNGFLIIDLEAVSPLHPSAHADHGQQRAHGVEYAEADEKAIVSIIVDVAWLVLDAFVDPNRGVDDALLVVQIPRPPLDEGGRFHVELDGAAVGRIHAEKGRCPNHVTPFV